MARLGRLSLGRLGEDAACRELARAGTQFWPAGSAPATANRHRRQGRADGGLRRGQDALVDAVRAPAEAVTGRKQAKVALMASEYLLRRDLRAVPCRFDVVAVLMPPAGQPVVEVMRGAFDSPGRWR